MGTGSGYQAAILGALGARVFTIERHKALHSRAKELLAAMKFRNVRCYWGDGYKGLPEFAPFDRIIVTAAAEEIPQTLPEQLKPGGFLVIPVGEPVQKMLRITRNEDGTFKEERFGSFRFVPFLKGKA